MAGWMVKGFQPTCCELLPYLPIAPQCKATFPRGVVGQMASTFPSPRAREPEHCTLWVPAPKGYPALSESHLLPRSG